jgi:hypothetical protein
MKTTTKQLSLLLGSASFAAAAMAAATSAQAGTGTIILEGSDAIGYHCSLGQAGACAYMNQTWSAIGGADARPIAVVGATHFGDGPIIANSTSHGIVRFNDLSTAGALNQYAAIYFTASGGCCSSNPGDMGGREADVTAYVGIGGTIEIANYDGNAGWDFLVGGSGNGAFVQGAGSDSELGTAEGLATGFTHPPALGTWSHQAYDLAHFASLGFTHDFYDYGGHPGFGMLISTGKTITGGGGFGVPEPATWGLMLVGFGGLGSVLRSRRRQAMAAA